jgi:hypothetical protein
MAAVEAPGAFGADVLLRVIVIVIAMLVVAWLLGGLLRFRTRGRRR